ncbi:MAG: hypothetical protein AAFY71_12195 [Bacteroidota bacterium]
MVEGPSALGFSKVPGLAPSLGNLHVRVLFVDFDDVAASKSPDSVLAMLDPIVPEFFQGNFLPLFIA